MTCNGIIWSTKQYSPRFYLQGPKYTRNFSLDNTANPTGGRGGRVIKRRRENEQEEEQEDFDKYCHKVRGQVPQEPGLNVHRPTKTPNVIHTFVVQDRYTCDITFLFAIIGSFCL